MSDFDFGTYVMKLFDPLIAESKKQLTEARSAYVQGIPRRTQSNVPIYQAENFVREMADQLIKINQDLLNQYCIKIAKQARSSLKNSISTQKNNTEDIQQLLAKKEKEVEGLQKKVHSLEQRSINIEKEKDVTLSQFSLMDDKVKSLESRESTLKAHYEQKITDLTTEYEEKFRKNQEEWDSYVKLKLAEQEVQSANISSKQEEE
ncbi:MAG: hypothetical protein KAT16_07075 [Candidatus Heimdallarchaeota archaeon]|nr:hypothetical protein [Candidatus Heimdallarchaeota archaeon]